MNVSSTIRAGAVCAVAGAFILIGMMSVVIGGDVREPVSILGQPGTPDQYAAVIRPATAAILQTMALDNIFLIAYTGAFIGAAALVWDKARVFGMAGLGFAILLALLDVTENAVTVDIVRAVQGGVPIPGWEIPALGVLEQVKYATGTLAIVFFAVGVWVALPKRLYAKIVAGLFLIFPVTNAVKIVGGSPLLLVVWMLVMLVASAGLLWREGRGASGGGYDAGTL